MSVQFVIVGAPRTGSTLLVKTLNTLDDVRCHGELLGVNGVRGYEDGFDPANASQAQRDARMTRLFEQRRADPLGFIQQALSSDCAATGFKALYAALQHPDWQAVVDDLLSRSTRFVHLLRNNELRRYVSEQILLAGGPIHSGAGGRSEQSVSVHIDIDAFASAREAMRNEAQQVRERLAGCPLLELDYEALSRDTAGTVAGVCRFLGVQVEPRAIVPALRKVGAADLRAVVSNYDELLASEVTRELLLAD
ncbi:MAG: hypothetical protein CME59_18705 [Halioglobus sp.]|nr:hypothetical protein [Halioglobus sp.]